MGEGIVNLDAGHKLVPDVILLQGDSIDISSKEFTWSIWHFPVTIEVVEKELEEFGVVFGDHLVLSVQFA